MNKKTCIVLVGAPCSGKSSAGKLVASETNIKYISSGDIARKMAKLDNTIRDDLNMGKLAPESQMRNAISNSLWQRFMAECVSVVILDGFPRFGEQAEWLRNTLPANIDIKYVLFDTPLSTIIERSAHRDRDDDKSLEQRLNYYYNTTYKELYKYINIIIDANENTVSECSRLLIEYIKEVTNVKNC